MRIQTALLMALLPLAGCAGSGDAGLDRSQRSSLSGHLADARTSAEGADAAAVEAALVDFREEVDALEEEGAIDADEAARMRLGAGQAAERAQGEVRPPATAPKPQPENDTSGGTDPPSGAATAAPGSGGQGRTGGGEDAAEEGSKGTEAPAPTGGGKPGKGKGGGGKGK